MLMGSHENDGQDAIVKAKNLYHELMDCDTPQEFRKKFGEAIQKHSLDEFYPVVVLAELSAALMICHLAASQVKGFSFRDHLQEFCGVKPAQMVNLRLQSLSDITDMPLDELEPVLRGFGYTLKDGVIANHPEATRKKDDVVSLEEQRKNRNAG